jgi:hypothetical protein
MGIKQGIKFRLRVWYRPEIGPDGFSREGGHERTQASKEAC